MSIRPSATSTPYTPYEASSADARWHPRMPAHGHSRTRSLSEVFERGRRRAQSVTATEVVETLKAPISFKLVVRKLSLFSFSTLTGDDGKALCIIWYLPLSGVV
jgi:hypothetical protein